MTQQHSGNDHISAKIHWPTVLQFALSSLAVFGIWSTTVLMAMAGVMQYFAPRLAQNDPAPLMVMAAAGVFAGLLLMPSIIFSGARLLNHTNTLRPIWMTIFRVLHPRWLLLLLPIVLVIGHWVSTKPIAWWLLPPFHVLATFIPLAWLVWLAGRGLKKGSLQRDWGVFSSGLVLAPALVFFLEIISLIIISILFVLYVSQTTEIMTELESVMMQWYNTQPSVDQILQGLGDFLNTRISLSIALVYLAVLVPLTEEIIKPIGVWLLGGRELSAQDGLYIGMLSGAGFALFENLSSFNSETSWVLLILMRVTTTLMHMATAGLTGWALAGALKQRGGLLRLLGAFLLSVLIHALWNANVVLFAFTNIMYQLTVLSRPPLLPYHLQFSSPLLMAYLALAAFVWIILANHLIRGKEVVKLALDSETDNQIGE